MAVSRATGFTFSQFVQQLAWHLVLAFIIVAAVQTWAPGILAFDGKGANGGFEFRRIVAEQTSEAEDGESASPGQAEYAPLLSSEITVDITGFIVRTVVKQRFKNQTSDWIEGSYNFPLPNEAAIDGFTMIVGDRRIEGLIKEKAEAKRIYTAAVKAGKKAALLSQARPNMFTTKIGNVAPGSEISVELTFFSYARQDGLSFSWRFPQAITPRYASPGEALVRAGRGSNAVPTAFSADTYSEGGGANLSGFAVTLNAGTALDHLASSSHSLVVTERDGGLFEIGLKGGHLPADRDFVLRWTLAATAEAQPLLFKEQYDGETYILGMILPPAGNARNADSGSLSIVPPRDVSFILDVSGSMQGASIIQAKAALLRALDLLRPEDRFDITLFNHEFSRLFGSSQSATTKNLAVARTMLRSVEADGGTEMRGALRSSLADSFGNEDLRQIMFLTDGAVGYEEEMFRMVSSGLGRARLFMVGLGSAPNSWFMRKAAEFGRGLHVQIGDVSEAQSVLEGLFEDMARPSVSSLVLEADDNSATYPSRLPDLFGDRPAVFVSKLGRGASGIRLSGRRGSGDYWTAAFGTENVATDTGIAKLWARKKIEDITDDRVRGMPYGEAKALILEVALSYKILSEYTSFVAVEDRVSRNRAEALKRAAIQANLPKGTSADQFFGPQTATAMMMKLQFGLGGLLLAAAMFFLASRRRGRNAI